MIFTKEKGYITMREMRRKKQLLSEQETIEILERGTNGVLAVEGDDGYPYAVPLSYVYCDGKIYFHGAKKGHKIDAISRNDKASFCVVDKDQIVPEKYTTYFRSAIAFGRVRSLDDDTEKREYLMKLAMKYSGIMGEDGCRNEMEREFPAVNVLEFTIEHMTGKEAIELVRAKQEK